MHDAYKKLSCIAGVDRKWTAW